jgi:poly(A) polymerase
MEVHLIIPFMNLISTTTDRTLSLPYGEAAYKVVEALTDKGFDTWWVGGGVREMLRGVVPKDIDIATAALPAEIAETFPKTDMKGSEFGSTRVSLGSFTFEVTTFREDDTASDGRHPEAVSFGTREKDAARRDFTVNAIYFHPVSRQIFDPYEGVMDLKERLVRFIGAPGIRIKHDALRMLRAVRLRTLLEGQYHPETYRALLELAPTIEVLSGFRIFEELEKLLKLLHADRGLEDLWELRILHVVLPELADCKGVAQPMQYHHEGDVWNHLLACVHAARDEDSIDVRIAALFHDCGKAKTFGMDSERIRFDEHATVSADLTAKALDRLQCPARRRDKIVWLIRHHMMMGAFFDMPEERKGHWYFHPWFPELLAVFYLDIAGTDPADFSLYEKILQDMHAYLDRHPRPAKPLLTGDDVMALLGIEAGEEVGKILKSLHDAQTRGEIQTKGEAKEFLRAHYRQGS